MRYLLPQGHLDSAMFELQLAQGLDPFSGRTVLKIGKVHFFNGDSGRAIKAFQRTLQMGTGRGTTTLALAEAQVEHSLADQALKILQTASWPTGDEARLAVTGRIHALSGRPGMARQVLQQLAEVARHH